MRHEERSAWMDLNTLRRRIIVAVITWAAGTILLVLAACSEPPATPAISGGTIHTVVPAETESSPRNAASVPTGDPGIQGTVAPAQTRTPARPTPLPTGDVHTPPSQASELLNGATWVLVSLDGELPIDGTFASLRVNDDHFGGFDGCNLFGGRHDDGTPVAKADGTFSTPSEVSSTLIGCTTPQGILDQADSYMRAIRTGDRFHVIDDRLEILAPAGGARLVFTKQDDLPGHAADLTGTQWRLMSDGGEVANGDEFTLAFMDDSLAAGTSVCRDFATKYIITKGRLGFPATSMIGSAAECPTASLQREGNFTDILSWADEYSVEEEEGKTRLRIRTVRGRTLTFESIPRDIGGIFGVEWLLTALVKSPREGLESLAIGTKDAVPEMEVTLQFEETGFWGSTGCNSYASSTQTKPGEAGDPIVGEDGSVAQDRRTTVSQRGCPEGPMVMEQERRFVELLPLIQRVQVFGDRLAIHTGPGVFLLYQAK